jgi:hypothetical protein
MSTTSKLYAAFLEKWEGANVDLSKLQMMLDASETVLKTKFKEDEITPLMITKFSKVVALQIQN